MGQCLTKDTSETRGTKVVKKPPVPQDALVVQKVTGQTVENGKTIELGAIDIDKVELEPKVPGKLAIDSPNISTQDGQESAQYLPSPGSSGRHKLASTQSGSLAQQIALTEYAKRIEKENEKIVNPRQGTVEESSRSLELPMAGSRDSSFTVQRAITMMTAESIHTRTRRSAFSVEACKMLVEERRLKSLDTVFPDSKDIQEELRMNSATAAANFGVEASSTNLQDASGQISEPSQQSFTSDKMPRKSMEEVDEEPPVAVMDDELATRLENHMRSSFLFRGMAVSDLSALVREMVPHLYAPDDVILEQGALQASEECLVHIIDYGEVEVIVHGVPEEQLWQLETGEDGSFRVQSLEDIPPSPCRSDVAAATGGGGTSSDSPLRTSQQGTTSQGKSTRRDSKYRRVSDKSQEVRRMFTRGPGEMFGEVALLFVSPRTADVMARAETRTWTLSRKRFLQCHNPETQMLNALRETPLLQKLTDNMLIKLAQRLDIKTFQEGDVLVNPGTEVNSLLIVLDGVVAEIEQNPMSDAFDVTRSRKERHGFFGDIYMLTNSKCRVRCEAVGGSVKAVFMTKADFLGLRPLLQPVLDAYLKYDTIRKICPFLTSDQIELVTTKFEEDPYIRGQQLLEQGSSTEKLFLVKSGEVDVIKSAKAAGGAQGLAGNKAVLVKRLTYGHFFGEKALISRGHTSAGALVVVSPAARCLTLTTARFEAALGPLQKLHMERESLSLLRACKTLRTLNQQELSLLVKEFQLKTVGDLDYIIKQGDIGSKFYVLRKGEAVITKSAGPGDPPKDVMRLRPGDQFGERALLFNEPRAANVIASGENVEVMFITREAFERHLGPLKDIMARHVEELQMSFQDIEQLKVIGKGMFGQVRLARNKRTGTLYALKVMLKDRIIRHVQQDHVLSERAVMSQLRHWTCVGLRRCFHDRHALYFLLEFVQGGELFRHLQQQGALPEDHCRFYAAQVLLALEHMHSKGFVFRDLKPENVLIDMQGYIKLVDFGFAKKVAGSVTYTICGTPDYQAPEVILRRGHNRTVDCWSLGVLIYEMLSGYTPFNSRGSQPKEIFRAILHGVYTIPMTISDTAADLIMLLLQHDPAKRLGNRGLDEIRAHPFFKSINWQALEQRKVTPPFIPEINDVLDVSNFDSYVETKIPDPEYDDTDDNLWKDWEQCVLPPSARHKSSSSNSKSHH